MKVKLLVSFASASGAFAPGDEYETDEREAGRLIAAGFAEPIEPKAKKKPAVETAADSVAVETATAD